MALTPDEHLDEARKHADAIKDLALTSPAYVARALTGILHALLAQSPAKAAPTPRKAATRRPFSDSTPNTADAPQEPTK
jgi:hypothetical protein